MRVKRGARAGALLGALALLLVGGLGGVGCVSPAQVPQEDPRVEDARLVMIAAREVLEAERYPIVAASERQITSGWVGSGPRRYSVRIVVQDTNMALALRTHVQVAVPASTPVAGAPAEPPEASAEAPLEATVDEVRFELDGQMWRVAPDLRPEARAEQERLQAKIAARWRELRREARPSPSVN